MKTVEDLHADLQIVEKIGLCLSEDSEVIDVLNSDYEDAKLSIDEEGIVWGNSVDPTEYDNITTEQGLSYYASRLPILPADLMM